MGRNGPPGGDKLSVGQWIGGILLILAILFFLIIMLPWALIQTRSDVIDWAKEKDRQSAAADQAKRDADAAAVAKAIRERR